MSTECQQKIQAFSLIVKFHKVLHSHALDELQLMFANRIYENEYDFVYQSLKTYIIVDGQEDVILFLLSVDRSLSTIRDEEKSFLDLAAMRGHERIIRWMFDQNLVPESDNTTASNENALHHAAIMGHVNVMTLLLQERPKFLDSINRLDTFFWCFSKGHLHVVELLLKMKLGLTQNRDRENRTVAHLAALYGYDKLVERLLMLKPELLLVVAEGGINIFHAAARSGSEVTMTFLLNLKAGFIDSVDSKGWTALHHAASTEEGHKGLNYLLGLNPSLFDAVDIKGKSPLRIAFLHERSVAAECLLSLKKESIHSINAHCESGSLLHLAAKEGSLKFAKLVLYLRPDLIDNINSDGSSVLTTAVKYGQQDMIDFLLQLKPSLVSVSGTGILLLAVEHKHAEVTKLLFKRYPALINEVDEYGNNVLHFAAVTGQEALVKMFLNFLPELATQANKNGDLPIHVIMRSDQKEVMGMLVESSPETLFVQNIVGNTVLHLFCFLGIDDLVVLLLEMKPNLIDFVDDDGCSILHLLIREMNTKALRLVVSLKPELFDMKNKEGQTALQLAIRVNEAMALTLLQISPNSLESLSAEECRKIFFAALNIAGKEKALIILATKDGLLSSVTEEGKTALHISASNGNLKLVDLLLMLHPNLLERVDKFDFTALHEAAKQGHLEIVQRLVAEKSTLVNYTDANRKLPIHRAIANGHVMIAKWLAALQPDVFEEICRDIVVSGVANWNHVSLLKLFLELKPDLSNVLDDSGKNVMFHLIEHEYMEFIQCVHDMKPELIDMSDFGGNNVLYYAVQKNRVDMVELLLRLKPQLIHHHATEPLLFVAARCRDQTHSRQICEVLLREKLSLIDIKNNNETVLHAAIRLSSAALVDLFLTVKPSLINIPHNNQSCIQLAGSDQSIISILLRDSLHLITDKKENDLNLLEETVARDKEDLFQFLLWLRPNFFCDTCSTRFELMTNSMFNCFFRCNPSWISDFQEVSDLLFSLLCAEHLDLLEKLVEVRPSLINVRDPTGMSILHKAIKGAHDRLIEKCLEWRPSFLDEVSHDKVSVLHIAVETSCKAIELILKRRPDMINVCDTRGITPLHLAFSSGKNAKFLNFLLQLKPNPLDMFHDKQTLLHLAIKARMHVLVKEILCQYPSFVESVDENKVSTMHMAAGKGGDVGLVKMLLDRRPDFMNEIKKDGKLFLFEALKGESNNFVEFLLSILPELIDSVDENGQTALHIAVRRKNSKLINFFCSLKPELLEQFDGHGDYVVHTSSSNESVVRKLLFYNKELIYQVNRYGQTIVHLEANSNSNISLLKFLLSQAPELLSVVDHNKVSVLDALLNSESHLLVEFSLRLFAEKGLTMEICESLEHDILCFAISRGNYYIVELLLVVKKRQTTSQRFSLSAVTSVLEDFSMFYSSRENNEKIFLLFLRHHPELIDLKTFEKRLSMLHIAASHGWKNAVEALTKLSNSVDRDGDSAAHLAARAGHEQIVATLLVSQPSLIDKVNAEGHTLLHAAAEARNPKLLKMLFDQKLELIDIVDFSEKTPLCYCVSSSHRQSIEFLLLKARVADVLENLPYLQDYNVESYYRHKIQIMFVEQCELLFQYVRKDVCKLIYEYLMEPEECMLMRCILHSQQTRTFVSTKNTNGKRQKTEDVGRKRGNNNRKRRRRLKPQKTTTIRV